MTWAGLCKSKTTTQNIIDKYPNKQIVNIKIKLNTNTNIDKLIVNKLEELNNNLKGT